MTATCKQCGNPASTGEFCSSLCGGDYRIEELEKLVAELKDDNVMAECREGDEIAEQRRQLADAEALRDKWQLEVQRFAEQLAEVHAVAAAYRQALTHCLNTCPLVGIENTRLHCPHCSETRKALESFTAGQPILDRIKELEAACKPECPECGLTPILPGGIVYCAECYAELEATVERRGKLLEPFVTGYTYRAVIPELWGSYKDNFDFRGEHCRAAQAELAGQPVKAN